MCGWPGMITATRDAAPSLSCRPPSISCFHGTSASFSALHHGARGSPCRHEYPAVAVVKGAAKARRTAATTHLHPAVFVALVFRYGPTLRAVRFLCALLDRF